jgi:glutamyl-tRNA synthetase
MDTNINKKVITRFAPSPTGFIHVGNLRSALYTYLFAKKNNGTLILRIEDTDKEREVKGATEHILKVLKWIGINWDEGPDIGGPNAPYTQSQRLDLYKKYAEKLIKNGLAYPDPYTEKEVEKFRKKAELEKRPFLFREHRPTTFEKWDETLPLRFKVSELKVYHWHDLVFGDLSAGHEALDDFVLIKSDGFPTYNFCHVVDDIEMGITHVIRGQEYISSIPKYLSLYEALNVDPPIFVCLPHIMGKDGIKKLGKRDGAKDSLEYRDDGYLPEAMVNFLALLGWHESGDKELFTMKELIKIFEAERIQKAGAQWDDNKLNWINREYLKKLSAKEQEEYVEKFIPQNLKVLHEYNKNIIKKITPIIMERISCGKDIIEMVKNGELTYYFGKPSYQKDSLFFKSSKIPRDDKYKILSSYLEKTISLLSSIKNSDFNKENIKNTIWSYTEEVGRGDVLWPMRYALSGVDKSPDPFILAEILGKEETINRLKTAISLLKI